MKSQFSNKPINDNTIHHHDDKSKIDSYQCKAEICVKQFEDLKNNKDSILEQLPESCALIEECLYLGNQIYILMYLITIEGLDNNKMDLKKFDRLCNRLATITQSFSDKFDQISSEFTKRKSNPAYQTTIVPPHIMPTYDHQAQLMIRNELYVGMTQLYLLSISKRYRSMRDDLLNYISDHKNTVFDKDKSDLMLTEISILLPIFKHHLDKFNNELFAENFSKIKGAKELKIFTKNMHGILINDAITLNQINFPSSSNYIKNTVKTTFKQTVNNQPTDSPHFNETKVEKLAV